MACHKSTVTFLCLLALHGFHLEACDGARFVGSQEAGRITTDFIRSSCGATTYPSLCYSSLSAYASTIQTSPTQLATTALVVTLSGARNASSAFRRAGGGCMAPRVAASMADCVENLADSVGQLKESLAAMGRLGHAAGKALAYQINSVQTWVSAALTDEDTCVDEFAGATMEGEVKVLVRSHVVKVAHLTSNALALVSGLAASPSPP